MDTILKQTREFILTVHQTDNSGHDMAHINRVYQNAERLLVDTSQADAFIVRMSALLHDVDDHKMSGDGQRVKRFLATLPLSDEIQKTILSTIDAIGFSKSGENPHFDTIEQAILSDADKLDAMGAMGVCRTILFGAHKGTPLFDMDAFPAENLTRAEYNDFSRRTNTSINHFFDKLLRLKNAMKTPAGRVEAEKRHMFMVEFLTHFFEEQGLKDWLLYLRKWLEKH